MANMSACRCETCVLWIEYMKNIKLKPIILPNIAVLIFTIYFSLMESLLVSFDFYLFQSIPVITKILRKF